jgi:hypothetical protein
VIDVLSSRKGPRQVLRSQICRPAFVWSLNRAAKKEALRNGRSLQDRFFRPGVLGPIHLGAVIDPELWQAQGAMSVIPERLRLPLTRSGHCDSPHPFCGGFWLPEMNVARP